MGECQVVISNASYPGASRDGHLLAYVALPNADGTGQSLWIAANDGSNPRQLLPAGAFVRFSSLRMAPSGERLLFAAVGQGTGYVGSSDPLGVLGWLTGVAHAD